MSEGVKLAERITSYLSSGGLFNPELAIHDNVRSLLIESRAELSAAERTALDYDRIDALRLAAEKEVDVLAGELEVAKQPSPCGIEGHTKATLKFTVSRVDGLPEQVWCVPCELEAARKRIGELESVLVEITADHPIDDRDFRITAQHTAQAALDGGQS